MSNNRYYLATLARSYDEYHNQNNLIHLLFSGFYSNALLTRNLRGKQIWKNESSFVVRLVSGKARIGSFGIMKHSKFIMEFELSYEDFMNWTLVGSKSETGGLDTFLDELIKPHYHQEGQLVSSPILNRVLFVFEDLNWEQLRNYFRDNNMIISGGSISKRNQLSTTEFNLSRWLMIMDYDRSDVYNSTNYLSKEYKQKVVNPGFSKQILFNINYDSLEREIANCVESRKEGEKERDQLIRNVKSLEEEQLDRLKGGKSLSSDRAKRLNNNIDNLKKRVKDKEKGISS